MTLKRELKGRLSGPENHRKPTEMKNGIPERQWWLSEGCCHREESEITDGVATICSEWTENNVFVCVCLCTLLQGLNSDFLQNQQDKITFIFLHESNKLGLKTVLLVQFIFCHSTSMQSFGATATYSF